ncbi:hypothetical protein SAMN06265348_12137 [Pedobacter westerhofensis]|uniref:Uncharacterized protein n=1 Tax=Pedobacter westerhofensis TaxID=425512 RepID=A0A521FSX8_9SPHI|nr:hypothetical protein [Pedobacter westerhofensis]SMO99269.1 hypothetical protein SAMN06265348_12137 [Pedobacter westerhofensis]
MALTRYENADQVPVFIQVLDIIAYFYAQISLKIAILNHYQELKTPPDLRQTDDAVLVLISSAVNDITDTMERTAKIYSIDPNDFLNRDQHITGLAEDLYWSLVQDEFPDCITEADAGFLDYFDLLEQYGLSVLGILNSLSDMFCTAATDRENTYGKCDVYNRSRFSRSVDPNNKPALIQLLQLNNMLRGHHDQINKCSLTFKS